MNNNIEVKVESNGSDLNIRMGSLPEQKLPIKIEITGDITAPANWVLTKDFTDKDCHALVCITNKTIEVVIDEKNPFRTVVRGAISDNPDLDTFKINSNTRYSHTELKQLIKFNKMFIPDSDRYFKILEQLENLKGSVITHFENTNNEKGSKKYQFEQELKDKFDLNFTLSIPIIKNGNNLKFNVEVNYEVSDGSVTFWLVSVELKELTKKLIDELIKTEIDKINTKINTIIYV